MVNNYLDNLNEPQHEGVVNVEGPCMIIAGAGSGKTRVLTYRIAHLLQSGVAPWEILTLTFTNKSAREMMQRVNDLIGGDLSRLWGGTFHSVGLRILRRHADRLGYRPDFTVADREDTKDLLAAFGPDRSHRTPLWPEELAGFAIESFGGLR